MAAPNGMNRPVGGGPPGMQPPAPGAMPGMAANYASMPPIKREALRVKLADSERGFYSNMYTQVNPEGKREVESGKIVQFLMKSGLPISKLKDVWQVAARTSNDYMVKDEFYVALRLIAYLQNDIAPNEGSIKLNIDAPRPRFDGSGMGGPVDSGSSSLGPKPGQAMSVPVPGMGM